MPGVETGVEVGLDYASGSRTAPSSLTIDVRADRPWFPHETVTKRLRREAGGSATIQSNASCSVASQEPSLGESGFASDHPDGVWILCDEAATRETATATLLRYLFNASQDRALVARRIDVTLTRHARRWRITGWQDTAIDYAR